MDAELHSASKLHEYIALMAVQLDQSVVSAHFDQAACFEILRCCTQSRWLDESVRSQHFNQAEKLRVLYPHADAMLNAQHALLSNDLRTYVSTA